MIDNCVHDFISLYYHNSGFPNNDFVHVYIVFWSSSTSIIILPCTPYSTNSSSSQTVPFYFHVSSSLTIFCLFGQFFETQFLCVTVLGVLELAL